MELLCSRPSIRDVDFDTSRFVVCKENGLDVGLPGAGVVHLCRGDLVPEEALDARALALLYDTPCHALETLEHALTLTDLCEACARRGVTTESAKTSAAGKQPDSLAGEAAAVDFSTMTKDQISEYLNSLSREQLSALCYQSGLDERGSKKQLRSRLSAMLE